MLSKTSRILIVDDFEIVREMLKSSLKNLGYNKIEDAEDGKIALNLIKKSYLKKTPFSLVFTDWHMPNMTGIELLQACQADETLKQTMVVFVTAESEKNQVIQALRFGALGFIVKPFSQEALQKKLDQLSKRLEGY